MKIKLTSIYVDDQDRALRFYTDVLGFVKKADFRQGPFRWLTVASPDDPDEMPPTKVTGSTIAVVNDTRGNLIQIAAVDRWQG